MPALIAATVLAGAAAAAAIALAPVALADRGDRGVKSEESSQSIDRGPHKATPAQRGGVGNIVGNRAPDYSNLPKQWTNEAMWARPGQNPFGAGPKPPGLALD